MPNKPRMSSKDRSRGLRERRRIEEQAVRSFTREFKEALSDEGALLGLACRIAGLPGHVQLSIGWERLVRDMLGEEDQDKFTHEQILEVLLRIGLAFQDSSLTNPNPYRRLIAMTVTWAADILSGEKTIEELRAELGSEGTPFD